MSADDGFKVLQAMLDSLTADLGGTHVMRRVVASSASELVKHYTEALFPSYKERCRLYPNHYLFATEEVFESAAKQLKEAFSLEGLPTPSMQSDGWNGGRLALRENTLRFETDKAGFPIVKARAERGGKQMVFLTADGEFIAEEYGKKPSVCTIHVASESGALKSMMRLADDAFKAPLMPVLASE